MSKKGEKPKKRRRERAGTPTGDIPTMKPEDFRPEGGADPHGAAAIPPVTDAMMDHAAHAAAELADGVARGTMHPPEAAGHGAERAESTSADAAAQMSRAAGEQAAAAQDIADDAARRGADAVVAAADRAGDDAERVAEAAEAGLSNASDALGQYGAKLLEAMRANVAAAGAHAAALAQAKSVPEAAAVNAEHVRRQVEALTGQGRELAALAQRAVFEALQPFKGVLPRR